VSAEIAPLPSCSQSKDRVTARTARTPRSGELSEVEAELARQHWVRWLDTRVPALGNRTPRQAARTAIGRERLEALLADFAQRSTADSHIAPDLQALRRALALEPKP
jgi:hypothetical protein